MAPNRHQESPNLRALQGTKARDNQAQTRLLLFLVW
jgi:hypothetical protein